MYRNPYILPQQVKCLPTIRTFSSHKSCLYTLVTSPSPQRLRSQPPYRTEKRYDSVNPFPISQSPLHIRQYNHTSRCKTSLCNILATDPIYKIVYDDETVYFGQVMKNKRDGVGTLYDRHGHLIYLGEWRDDNYNGVGIWNNHAFKYSGLFNNGELDGQAIEETAEHKFYGFFKNGQRDGPGTLYNRRETIQGVWKEGILILKC